MSILLGPGLFISVLSTMSFVLVIHSFDTVLSSFTTVYPHDVNALLLFNSLNQNQNTRSFI